MSVTEKEFKEAAEEKAVDEGNWFHRWFTTIIPCGTKNEPIIINYCPNCRQIISQSVGWWYNRGAITVDADYREKAYVTKLDLPREGCVKPPQTI